MSKFLEAIHAAVHGRLAPATAGAAPDAASGNVKVAACALLLEIAYADGEFTAPERAHLESVLARHFGLDPEAGERLIAVAEQERRRSVDYFHFTSVLQREYDLGQKMVLAEIMWGLVLADGTIADREQLAPTLGEATNTPSRLGPTATPQGHSERPVPSHAARATNSFAPLASTSSKTCHSMGAITTGERRAGVARAPVCPKRRHVKTRVTVFGDPVD